MSTNPKKIAIPPSLTIGVICCFLYQIVYQVKSKTYIPDFGTINQVISAEIIDDEKNSIFFI